MTEARGRAQGTLRLRLRRYSLLATLRTMTRVPPAGTLPTSRVTIVVPARNEEQSIEKCVRSLLNQTYGNFNVIVVDDASEDATPLILIRLAAEFPRLRVIPAPPLPPGWSGKCWAVATGAAQAGGEWLLFTDADTEHEPGGLAAVVFLAESNHLDMLSLMPRHELASFWERAILPAIFAILLQAGGSFEEVNDARSSAAWAAGAFMLIRRAVYESVGGHETVRGEIVEDFALARLIKGQGYRLTLASGRDWVRTRLYRTFGEIWAGFSKSSFFGVGQSVARMSRGALLLLGLALGPFILTGLGIAWLAEGMGGYLPWLVLSVGGVGILWLMARGIGVACVMRIPWVYGLLHPLGVTIFVVILLNSAFLTLSGRGVKWKGRQYSGSAGGG